MKYKAIALGLCLLMGAGLTGCRSINTNSSSNMKTIENVEKGEKRQGFVACRIDDLDRSQLDDLMNTVHSHGLKVVSFSKCKGEMWFLIEKDANI